jgi:hypothetical protein
MADGQQPSQEQDLWLLRIRRSWLPIAVVNVVTPLVAAVVIFVFANVGGESPVWFLALLLVTIAVL